jgi:arylsulfatase A
MNRREFLKGVSLAAGGLATGGAVNAMAAELVSNKALGAGAGGKKPNIVVMLTDDMGYSDLGCYGHPYIKTPNIDKFASEGLRLTAAYCGMPICSPSRTALLTGRIPVRAGIYTQCLVNSTHPMHLRTTEITIAKILQQTGYNTAQFGKWHLNTNMDPAQSGNQPRPREHGFDYYFGLCGGYAPDKFWRNDVNTGPYNGYSCEIVVNDAMDWLENQRDKTKPFFAYINFNEPHIPILSAAELPSDIMAMYPLPIPQDANNACYYATVTNMDRHIGRFLDKLDTLHLRENTIVIFTSDNGPLQTPLSKLPLRGYKKDVYEGGIRTPCIIRWPGYTKPNTECDDPISFVDYAPTFAALAGTSMPTDRAIDGTSFLPIFECKPIVRKTPLFWYFYRTADPQVALRQGDWILLGRRSYPFPDNSYHDQFRKCHMQYIKMENASYGGFNFQDTAWEEFKLYNIKDDIGQQKDLSASEPKRFNAMKQKLIAMYDDVVAEGYRWPDEVFTVPERDWDTCPLI